MKIVIVDGHTLAADGNSWSDLEDDGDVELFDRSAPDEVVERARPATILVTNKAAVRVEAIEAAPHLKFIAVSATAFDCVDVAAARSPGRPTNVVIGL